MISTSTIGECEDSPIQETALLQKLQASEAGQWVVASLHQQRVLVVSPNGDTYLYTSKASAFENRDWNLLRLGMPR